MKRSRRHQDFYSFAAVTLVIVLSIIVTSLLRAEEYQAEYNPAGYGPNEYSPSAAEPVSQYTPTAEPVQIEPRLDELELISYVEAQPYGAIGNGKSAVATDEVSAGNPQADADVQYEAIRERLIADIGSTEGLSWKKGDFQLVPYGFLWASASYETQPSNIGSTSFFLRPPKFTGSQSHLDYRGTILGMAIKGPSSSFFGNVPVTGKVEFDLQRTIDFENKASLHLRHCYFEVQTECYRLLAGQTWDVVSPLNAGTIMYDAGWMDGNVGYRRTQFRYERYFYNSPCSQWKLQTCIASPIAADQGSLLGGTSAYNVKCGSFPLIEGRIAYALGNRTGKQKPMEIGVAAHYGQMQYGQILAADQPDRNYYIDTYGLYVDAYIPITCRFGFQGEFFTGSDMSMFLGGIGQGITLDESGVPQGVRTLGGWGNIWYNLTDKTQMRVGFMIDDPQEDFAYWTARQTASARTLNQALFTNIMTNFTPNFRMGLEYSHRITHYTGKDEGKSEGDRIDFVTMYSF